MGKSARPQHQSYKVYKLEDFAEDQKKDVVQGRRKSAEQPTAASEQMQRERRGTRVSQMEEIRPEKKQDDRAVKRSEEAVKRQETKQMEKPVKRQETRRMEKPVKRQAAKKAAENSRSGTNRKAIEYEEIRPTDRRSRQTSRRMERPVRPSVEFQEIQPPKNSPGKSSKKSTPGEASEKRQRKSLEQQNVRTAETDRRSEGRPKKRVQKSVEYEEIRPSEKRKRKNTERPGVKKTKERSARPSSGRKVKKSASPSLNSSEKKKRKKKEKARKIGILIFTELGILIMIAICFLIYRGMWKIEPTAVKPSEIVTEEKQEAKADTGDLLEMTESVGREELTKKEPQIVFEPHCTEETDPSHLIQTYEVNVDGTTLSDIAQYAPKEKISFGEGREYTAMEGILTFRGNNFRDTAAYGYAEMKNNKLKQIWEKDTGSLGYGDTYWSGSGWTGQPLMMKWPKETKAAMNMFDWAKQDDDLVEVIYACMDGYIYFLDLETGKPTRDPMYLGYTFKGAGALDPRGYPIMYVGAGYDSNNGTARAFVINLLDCSVMYTFGNLDEFSLRGSLSYFDSSALVDAETDTLIYPGENGILYLIKLNTKYDQKAGTLSIAPDNIVKWHYYGTKTSVQSYWVGMETSAVIYEGYLFIADNGGILMCLDLNTLKPVWTQDILDDSNSTPVLSIEDGHPYIYVSTSFHLGWRSSTTAEVPIWKIDAETGSIIWQTSYECYSEQALSGGVQSTIALGENGLSDYIYVTVSKTNSYSEGVLVCLNKKTGKKEWEHNAFYTWSSPVCVYNSDGTGRVLYCSGAGKMYLLDGITGEVYDTLPLVEGMIEASPAVYNNYAVVGVRECRIFGVKLE